MFNIKHGVHYESLIKFLDLYKRLSQRGVTVKSVYFKILNLGNNNISYLKLDINDKTLKQITTYILTNKDITKHNYFSVAIPQNLYLEVTNLKKYKSYFRVTVNIGKTPTYLDLKIKDARQQTIINREINRYKRLFTTIWLDYSNNIQQTIKQVNDTIKTYSNNYVSVTYMNREYVKPQK